MKIPVHLSSMFSVLKNNKLLIAEASTLQNDESLFVPNYSGFFIRSEKTGNEARFALANIEHAGGCEILSWLFTPTVEALQKNPQLKGWSVRIFND